MLNNVTLVGRLTADPSLRYTPNGKAVANFTLAVDRGFGEKKETDFINCQVWGKAAENTANFTNKGSLVGVTGRIQVRNYEKDGKKVYITEVVAENVKFLGSKGGENTSESQYSQNGNNGSRGQNKASDDPFANGGQTIDISDSDLPF